MTLLAPVFRWLLNRGNIAPEIEAGKCCAVPGCSEIASEQWFPSFCALREAGVPIEWVPVCDKHDIELNSTSIKILFGDRFDAEVAAYKSRREPSKEGAAE